MLAGGVLFGHWRSDTTFSLVTGGATRRAVRKHRAPKGALRLRVQATQVKIVIVRKHRAPKGALRLVLLLQRFNGRRVGQKAPSAKRCIKTGKDCFSEDSVCADVRKHRAPKGALRPLAIVFVVTVAYSSQKAPSAKRCIKTALGITTCTPAPCQKAPSAKRGSSELSVGGGV